MKKIKRRNTLSLILNLTVAVLAVVSVGWFFTETGLQSGAGNMKSGGINCFCFFTIDSNILAALCCLLAIPFNILSVKNGKDSYPEWVLILKFIGTSAVTVTLLVVLFFLGPLMGYAEMFDGPCLELHLICPLAAIISFVFFERGVYFTKLKAFPGILPTFIYGTVYLVNVIFTEVWPDFYNFNINGCWYISYALMPGVAYLISLGLSILHNKIVERTE